MGEYYYEEKRVLATVLLINLCSNLSSRRFGIITRPDFTSKGQQS